MITRIRIALAVVICLLTLPASAATLDFGYVLTFDATKTSHVCASLGLPNTPPNPGDGNCGPYQGIAIGETVPSVFEVSGSWTTSNFQTFTLTALNSFSCFFGGFRCYETVFPSFFTLQNPTGFLSGQDLASLAGADYSLFSFDLLGGTGSYRFLFEQYPYTPVGNFSLSQVKFTLVSEVPLSTSVFFLLFGILGFFAIRMYSMAKQ